MGWLVGAAIQYVIHWVKNWLLKRYFRMEKMSIVDEFFLQDLNENVLNFVGVVFLEKFDFEEMKQALIPRTKVIHKCRSKVVQWMGELYFKQMSNSEFIKQID
mmetsp:Transcript_39007/g.59374  ORF Transcript_39007/g.59374 Transcript_39007/m.59374 type:complete len:103 (+) Transcript_39007:157-465(+)